MEATAPKMHAIVVILPASSGTAMVSLSTWAGKDTCELFAGVRVAGVSAGVPLSAGVSSPAFSSAGLFLLKNLDIAEINSKSTLEVEEDGRESRY